MRRDQKKDSGGDQEQMRYVKARESERTERVSATEQLRKPPTDKGDFSGDIGAYSCRKIGLLIPGQQVACEPHCENQKGE